MTTEKHIRLDSEHLNDITNAIRGRSVGWESHARAGLLTTEQATTIKTLEKELASGSVPNEQINLYVSTLLNVLGSASGEDNVKRTCLVLLKELFDKYDSSITCAVSLAGSDSNLLGSFLSFKDTSASGTLTAAYVVASILLQPGKHQDESSSCSKVFSALLGLTESDSQDALVAIRLVQELLTIKCFRYVFWEQHAARVPSLFNLLKKAVKPVSAQQTNAGIQLQYYTLLSLWLLTFEKGIANELASSYTTEILSLLPLARDSIKEKITRVCISILAQCPGAIRPLLLLGNALPIISTLAERKFTDDELVATLAELRDTLAAEYKDLTSWDEYSAELELGSLKWTPPHQDATFWTTNIEHFKDASVIKKLVSILKENKDKVSVSVALNDLCRVVELLPESIGVIGVDGKAAVMSFLADSDGSVRFEALKTTQAIVSHTFK